MAAARDVLTALGALDAEGRATTRGVSITRTGLHPRLGRALLDGAALVGARQAAELVALLSEEPPRALGDDLAAVHRAAAAGRDPYAARWRDEVRRLLGHIEPTDNPRSTVSHAAAGGLIVGLAFPERIARARAAAFGFGLSEARTRRPASYLMASGTAADTAPGSALSGAQWIAVAVADRPAGSPAARVQLAAVLDEATARRCAPPLLTDREEVRWAVPAGSRRGEVAARRVQSLGAIELPPHPSPPPPPTCCAPPCWKAWPPRPSANCSPGRPRPPPCVNAWISSTALSAGPGPRSTTRPCWTGPTSGWSPSFPAPAAAPTWNASARQPP